MTNTNTNNTTTVSVKNIDIVRIGKEKLIKCIECNVKHKMRNVANGERYCTKCWQFYFGVKK